MTPDTAKTLGRVFDSYEKTVHNLALDKVFEAWAQGRYGGPSTHEGGVCPSGACPACDEFSFFLQELRK